MTEDSETSTRQHPVEDMPRPAEPGPVDAGTTASQPTAGGPAMLQERAAAIANERPEVAAGAAFAGGLLFALILKRIAR